MRYHSLGALLGGLGLAALAAATPGDSLDTCVASNPSTVFVTVQSVTTVHDGPTSTVFVNVSEEPTTTLTRVKTLTRSVVAPASAATNAALVSTPDYETTVYQTVYATNTNYEVVAASGASVSYSESAAPNGLLTYIVVNGTTFWLNGQTPVPSQSYVIETSVVTVQPYNTPPPISEGEDTSTTTIRRTIFSTRPVTLTETEAPASSSSQAASPTASIGTGSPSFTGLGPQGWNATSSAAGAFGTQSTTSSYHPLPTFSYGAPITHTGSLQASSGFQVTSSAPDSRVSSSSLAAPYGNITFIGTTSTALGTPISALPTSCTDNPTLASSTSVISGVNATSVPFTSTLSPIIGLTSISPTATSTPLFGNSTSSVLSSTSSNLGAFTSETPTTTAISTSCTDSSTLASSTSDISSANATSALVTSTSAPEIGITTASVVATSTPLYDNSTSSIVTSALGAFTSEVSSATAVLGSTSSSFLGAPTSSSNPVTNFTSLLPSLPSSFIGTSTTSSNVDSSTAESSSSIATSTPYITIVASTTLSTPDSMSVASSTLSSSSTSDFSSVATLSTSFTSSSQMSSSATTAVSSQTSATVSSAYATATSCGEIGDFVLNFDDIPPLTIGQNQSATTADPMPVFNPYHQFDFSNGFVVVPPPTDPYLPSSKPLLTEFIPNFSVTTATSSTGPNAGDKGWSGDVGNGDHGLSGCFGFNAYGAAMGCDSLGPSCDFTFSGFRYNRDNGATTQVTQQSIAVTPCANLQSLTCELEHVTLDTTFQNLDTLRINVTVAGEPKIWWMDDLALGWYNNTCASGLCRLYTHVH